MKKITILLILALPIWAGVITRSFDFSADDITLTQYGQYTLVGMKGADVVTKEGEPILPSFIYHLVIPASAEIRNVEVMEGKVEYLPGRYLLYPGQKPRPISTKRRISFVAPKPGIYNSGEIYPQNTVEYISSGNKKGFRIVPIMLYPLRYIPDDGRLRMAQQLTVRVTYKEGVHSVRTLSKRQYEVFLRTVKNLVSNPEDVIRYAPNFRSDGINDVNYAIITDSIHVSDFESLKTWKTRKGYKTEIFSTDWIYSNYTGNDNPERIRRFLQDYEANKGLIWLLLAGDVQIVPERDIYSTSSMIACDWYYCDLDSNWNRNGNNYYGEIGDVIPPEAYFEIYCGRVPIDDTTEISRFLTKLDIFEKNPPISGIKKILLPSVELWTGYHGNIVNNAIGDMFPSGWTTIKLEDAQAYSPNPRNTLNSDNPQFCHIAAHGNQNGTFTHDGIHVLTSSDIPFLTNNLPFILNSIACYCGDFDEYNDCFAERLITNTDSGAVGVIMNARYGIGTPPTMGPSEQLDTCFYHIACYDDTLWLGVAHAESKEHFISPIWCGSTWHYCGTELNLFGDPEMYMYLNTPTNLYGSYQGEIPTGPQNFTVTVTDSRAPVEDALVCCYKENEVHETGWTDANGQVILSINPKTGGNMYVTASGFDHLPFEGSSTIGIAEQPDNSARIGVWLTSTVIRDQIKILYALDRENDLKVTLYNSIGSMVGRIFHKRISGKGSISWNTLHLPAGVYFLKIEHEKTEIKQIVLIR